MPRFVVQRTFPQGFNVMPNQNGARSLQAMIDKNSDQEVTWIHSYVNLDNSRTFCVCDAPDADAIRRAAQGTGMPVDQIIEVRVLDPYFYF